MRFLSEVNGKIRDALCVKPSPSFFPKCIDLRSQFHLKNYFATTIPYRQIMIQLLPISNCYSSRAVHPFEMHFISILLEPQIHFNGVYDQTTQNSNMAKKKFQRRFAHCVLSFFSSYICKPHFVANILMLKAAGGLLLLLPNSYNSRLTARFSNEFYAFVAGALHPPRQKSSIFTGEETQLRTSKLCPPTATTTAQPTLCNRTPRRPTRRV